MLWPYSIAWGAKFPKSRKCAFEFHGFALDPMFFHLWDRCDVDADGSTLLVNRMIHWDMGSPIKANSVWSVSLELCYSA